MRLKKVKGAKEKIEKSPYLIKDPSTHRGQFNKLFNNSNPIRVEIGMGKGNFILNNALKYPNINFIGIEKYDSVLVRAVEKIEEQNIDIPNLKLICMDASLIDIGLWNLGLNQNWIIFIFSALMPNISLIFLKMMKLTKFISIFLIHGQKIDMKIED